MFLSINTRILRRGASVCGYVSLVTNPPSKDVSTVEGRHLEVSAAQGEGWTDQWKLTRMEVSFFI